MGLKAKLVNQCRKPKGKFGKLITKGMNNFAKITKEGKVHGIDYSETTVEISKKVNGKFIESGIVEIKHASVSKLPFSKNTFNIVAGFETYYFWPDLINDLRGIFDVLNPGDTLLLVNEAYKRKNEKLRKRNEKWPKIGKFTINAT